MTIDILPATVADAGALWPVGELAFANNALNKRLMNYSKATPEQIAEARAWRHERTIIRMSGEGKYFFKAVDSETGAVAGYAGAYTPDAAKSATLGGAKTAALEEGAEGGRKEEGGLTPPEILDGEFAAKIEGLMEETKKKYLGEKAEEVWYIGTMVVHPDYQGKGIGLRLLAACCECSDKAGKDMYLESTPAGRKLYLKGGFKELGVMKPLDDEEQDVAIMLHPCSTPSQ